MVQPRCLTNNANRRYLSTRRRVRPKCRISPVWSNNARYRCEAWAIRRASEMGSTPPEAVVACPGGGFELGEGHREDHCHR